MASFHPEAVRKNPDSRGYLLIEVIMALTLLMIVFFTVVFMSTLAVKVSNFNKESTEVNLLLRSYFERYKSSLLQNFDNYAPTVTTDTTYNMVVRSRVDNSTCSICGPDLNKLIVTVSWSNKSRAISGLISRR